MIKFGCTSCGKRIGVADSAAGRRVKCPKCAEPTRVPDAPPAPVPANAAAGGLADLGSLDADGPLELQSVAAPAAVAAAPAPASRAAAPPPPAALGPDAKACPKCKAPAAASAKICVSCGHGFKGLSAANRMKTRKAGALAGRSGIAILGGLGTALVCGFLWAMIVKLIDREFGYMAIGLGAGTGFVTALIAQQQSVLVGLGAVLTAVLGWFVAKIMIAWLVIIPLLAGMGVGGDFSTRDAYVLGRLQESQEVDEAVENAAYGFDDASAADVAAWKSLRDGWIAANGEPGEDPITRETLVADRLLDTGLLTEETHEGWIYDELEPAERDRVRTLIEQDLRLHGEPAPDDAEEAIDPHVMTGIVWAFALLSAFSWFDFLWVPLMCAAAYKTGNGD